MNSWSTSKPKSRTNTWSINLWTSDDSLPHQTEIPSNSSSIASSIYSEKPGKTPQKEAGYQRTKIGAITGKSWKEGNNKQQIFKKRPQHERNIRSYSHSNDCFYSYEHSVDRLQMIFTCFHGLFKPIAKKEETCFLVFCWTVRSVSLHRESRGEQRDQSGKSFTFFPLLFWVQ